MNPGDRVRLIDNPSRTGVLTSDPPVGEGRRKRLVVSFPDGIEPVLEVLHLGLEGGDLPGQVHGPAVQAGDTCIHEAQRIRYLLAGKGHGLVLGPGGEEDDLDLPVHHGLLAPGFSQRGLGIRELFLEGLDRARG